jgi:predicted dehydrogenase
MGTEKLRFGIIGSNFIVDTVLEAARLDPRFECVAIYSRTQERADEYAAKQNIPHTFTSLEEMADSNLIDAVYIASPNSLHAQQSIFFMEHGKHVLCEKPLASNAREVKAMIEASEKYGVTLMEAMKPTLTPDFKEVIAHKDKIGAVRRYFSCYCQYSSRYDKLKEGIVLNAFRPELSNGAIMDLGVYTLYPMVVLFGRPKSINATGLLLPTGVDGQGAVNFEYEGMNATILYSKIADSSLPTEIQGEDATITLDRINVIKHVTLKYRKGGSMVDLSHPDRGNDYYYEIAEFIDLVQSGRRESAINSHENSLITIEIIDEIRRQLKIKYPADL